MPKDLPNFQVKPNSGAEEFLNLIASKDCPPEILVEGPAGTGKSRTIGQGIAWFLGEYDKCRVAVVRKTRVSLSESWLVTWETKCLNPDHPMIKQGPARANRNSYMWPNGSELILAGLDNPTRLFSTEFDLIYVNEATELTLNEWESLHRALRNNVADHQLLLGDCNPDSPHHWLNQRANTKMLHRILTRHWENPSLTKEYLKRLENSLTGHRRQRLWFGLWTAAEGQIWQDYNPSTHLVDAFQMPDKEHIRCYTAGVDWGFRNPGVILVAAHDKDDNVWIVSQTYHTGKDIDWWADQAKEIFKEFPVERFVCDPAEPEHIQKFNDALGPMKARHVDRVAKKANNAWMTGVDLVRQRLDPKQKGGPQIKIIRDSLRFRDPDLVEMAAPTCLEEEIPSYVYQKVKENKPLVEKAEPSASDHACDALRYLCMDWWGQDPGARKLITPWSKSTYHEELGHDRVIFDETL